MGARNNKGTPCGDTWLVHLEMLLVKFSHLGIDADTAGMDFMALWGVYLHLSRLEDGDYD